ncbi:hypothetical protein CI105_06525 [Candidatus Izimaplasma bacterium ZiA1]|uniref:hypothetical protein n=1 Tax=Candidatus Izimoplasma sp. ZiA1 TaxID=2024899 RepID=UPI000BAA9616|nr:hypothetical protein CI105_06525 [Candidatus Izimaplasma bacterium ZiA1]
MDYLEVLEKLEKDEITVLEAEKLLESKNKIKPGRRAHFVKMKIHVPNEGKNINLFLKILFILPLPIIFATMGLRLGKKFIPDMGDDENFDVNDIIRLLKYSKNTRINVDSKDAHIDIKII